MWDFRRIFNQGVIIARRILRIVGRIILYIFTGIAILLGLAFIASILFNNKLTVAMPTEFLQAVIVASTTLMAFTGVFLTSHMFSEREVTENRIVRHSKNFFILSIILGFFTILFALGWFVGWMRDPFLDVVVAVPKIVMIFFFLQSGCVYVAFALKFFAR